MSDAKALAVRYIPQDHIFQWVQILPDLKVVDLVILILVILGKYRLAYIFGYYF